MSSDKIVHVRVYLAVFFGLLALTAATAGVAFVDLGGRWNAAAAIAIAVIKALLVVLFFMHVRYTRALMWVFVGIGFFWAAILFGLTFADYYTREEIRGMIIGQAPGTLKESRAPGSTRQENFLPAPFFHG